MAHKWSKIIGLAGSVLFLGIPVFAGDSSCPAGHTYAFRVPGGYERTHATNPYGICVSNEDLQQNLVEKNTTAAKARTPAKIAAGKTYYMALNGNNANPGTEQAPFRSFSTGISKLQPGDMLLIRGGEYKNEFVKVRIPSGTSWEAGQVITVKSYPNEAVTFSNDTEIRGNYFHFGLGSTRYVIVEGIRVVNYGIELPGADHIRLKDWDAEYIGAHGSMIGGGNYIEFINMKVHGVIGSHGIYSHGNNCLIDGGEWHHNGDYGIHLKGNHEEIDDSSPDPTRHPHHWVIRNVRLYGNEGAIHYVGGGGTVIYNNMFYGHECGTMNVWFISGLVPGDPPKVINNTFYGNGFRAGGCMNGASVIRTDAAMISNNIFWKNGNLLPVQSGFSLGLNNLVNKDPLFVDAAKGDFHLKSGSPAIDAGANASFITADAGGDVRVQGKAIDIGAFEYGGVKYLPGLRGVFPDPRERFMPVVNGYSFRLSGKGRISLKAYGIEGRSFAPLPGEGMESGASILDLGRCGMASGMYLIRLEQEGGLTQVQKVMVP